MDVLKNAVKEGYGQIARRSTSKSPFNWFACCSPSEAATQISRQIGYTPEAIQSVPDGANMGIGCGNPLAFTALRTGDVVVDLGSGAGFDCFLAAPLVGETGKVVGIDITPEMVERATERARKGPYRNVEFLLGDIEAMPLPDQFADLIISNCVINLSTHKSAVFAEAFRVLKPGGQLMISDIVLLEPLPENIQQSVQGHIACISGAMLRDEYLELIQAAGFEEIKIEKQAHFPIELMMHDPVARQIVSELKLSQAEIERVAQSITSLSLSAQKR